ncbi:hypothetical protein ANAPRD1_00302 [Anaplasma phagocytophilum]|uniref:hypothetical protein n=1 Tax=Anaplasma phagocytophilum TaxID=948 RepID=UPI0007E1549A|nr:hypothetical protein [Anaplasma phagocytophilum]SCV62896.1 hypothetical protein ANAPRD1_00302 [Anaplasma phagocytophilum]
MQQSISTDTLGSSEVRQPKPRKIATGARASRATTAARKSVSSTTNKNVAVDVRSRSSKSHNDDKVAIGSHAEARQLPEEDRKESLNPDVSTVKSEHASRSSEDIQSPVDNSSPEVSGGLKTRCSAWIALLCKQCRRFTAFFSKKRES